MLENSVGLVEGRGGLVNLLLVLGLCAFLFLLSFHRFVDDLHHVLLQGLFLKEQSVFVPDKVRCLRIESVFLHASFEQANEVFIVWVLCESQLSAVVHELLEFLRVATAELLNGHFLLLLFDVVVLLVLAPTWKTLPRKTASQEVKQNMTNSLEIVSSGLFVSNMCTQTGIPGSPSQIFTFSEWNVFTF